MILPDLVLGRPGALLRNNNTQSINPFHRLRNNSNAQSSISSTGCPPKTAPLHDSQHPIQQPPPP